MSELDGLVKAIARELAAELMPLLSQQTTATAEPMLLTLHEAARYLSRSQSSLRSMISSGEIPERVVRRIGRRVYLKRGELDHWIAAQ